MLFVMEVDAGKFFLKYLRAKPGLLLPLGQLTKGPYLLVRYLASDIRLDIQLDIRVYIRTLIASYKKTIKDNQKIFHSGKLGWILCRFVYLVYIETRYALKGKAKHRKFLYTA